MNLIEELIMGEAKKQTVQNVVDMFYPKNSYMNMWLTQCVNFFAACDKIKIFTDYIRY